MQSRRQQQVPEAEGQTPGSACCVLHLLSANWHGKTHFQIKSMPGRYSAEDCLPMVSNLLRTGVKMGVLIAPVRVCRSF